MFMIYGIVCIMVSAGILYGIVCYGVCWYTVLYSMLWCMLYGIVCYGVCWYTV